MIRDREWGPINSDILSAYAEASGDQNPIHLDDGVAREMGLPGVIAHGMLSAGWLVTHATMAARDLDFGGQAGFCVKAVTTRFKAMTPIGSRITLSAAVKVQTEHELTFDVTARVGDAVTLMGFVTFIRRQG